MINNRKYESDLWKVLAKEKLADLSQFHQHRFCEEVPLYSRISDLSFLTDHSIRATNAVLLRFALKFLKAVISYDEHRTPYFAAITLWDSSHDDPIVPYLFVWSDSIRKMRDKLILNAPKEMFGKEIKRLVARLRLPEPFEVCEENSTGEMSRVFVGPSTPPYRTFVPLNAFRKNVASAK